MSDDVDFSGLRARMRVETDEKWRDLWKEIPFLQFPPGCEVQVIPPFGGATARFRIRAPGTDKELSVYLDHFDALGCVGQPYWELYPNAEHDCSRHLMADVSALMAEITELLK